MKKQDFDSLIDSLVESVSDYDLNDGFDAYDAASEVCSNCDHSFMYGKAWTLVDYARFENRELFLDAESESLLIGQANEHELTLDAMMLNVAFQILKLETLKRYFAKVDSMHLDNANTWRMECGCTEANVLDGNHNVCNNANA